MYNLNTRDQSNIWLQKELFEEGKILDYGFDLLNKCITSIDGIGKKEGNNTPIKTFIAPAANVPARRKKSANLVLR